MRERERELQRERERVREILTFAVTTKVNSSPTVSKSRDLTSVTSPVMSPMVKCELMGVSAWGEMVED